VVSERQRSVGSSPTANEIRLAGIINDRSIVVVTVKVLPHIKQITDRAKRNDADQRVNGADRIVPTGTSLAPFVRFGDVRYRSLTR
jgi:hypothetical protein